MNASPEYAALVAAISDLIVLAAADLDVDRDDLLGAQDRIADVVVGRIEAAMADLSDSPLTA